MAASLAIRLAGGAANSNPALSIGGAMSSVAATADTLFDTVSAAEALAGDTEYRKLFLYNDGDKALVSLRLWISDQANVGTLALALDTAGANVDGDTAADEDTPPSGETFTSPTTLGAGISVPDLAAGDRIAVWVRRTIAAATGGVSLAANAAQIRVDYEYVP